MKRNVAKISMAALAGASCMLSGHVAKAAVTITATKVASSVVFSNGTYDVIDFDLTGLTGTDATKGGSGQDAEVFELNGTWNVSGGTGTVGLAAIGKNAGTEGTNFLLGKSQTSYVAAPGLHSSYIPFPNDTGAVVTGGVGATATTGTVTSINDTWYVTPAITSGPAGGVEPGIDGPGDTKASGSSNDPYSNNGMLAEILVNPGASVSYSGLIFDYGAQTGETTSFSYTPSGGQTSSPGGSNKIISLIATGGSPQGTAPNGYGSAPLGTLSVQNAGGAGKYYPGYLNIPGGATSGYVAVTGFLTNDYPEVYALKLLVNGATPTASQISTIIADIDTSIGGQSNASLGIASVTTVAGSPYAGIFGGYSILITDTSVDPYFAFDFSSSGSDTTDADAALGPVTVTSIAAVPEPATAAGVILGAAGLLLGRRKNRVQAV